jgi:hypothetical protein
MKQRAGALLLTKKFCRASFTQTDGFVSGAPVNSIFNSRENSLLIKLKDTGTGNNKKNF